jgi:hypothetical protein
VKFITLFVCAFSVFAEEAKQLPELTKLQLENISLKLRILQTESAEFQKKYFDIVTDACVSVGGKVVTDCEFNAEKMTIVKKPAPAKEGKK